MPAHDARIDAYIAKAAPFARPILEHLRAVVHEACPTAEETLKWSAPHFTHGGRILAGMAAFKQHAAFAVPMLDASEGDAARRNEAMGQYGRITSLADLPAKRTLVAQLGKAVKAIDAGATLARARETPKPALAMPDDFARALAKTAGARKQFAAFAPGKQRDYVEWVVEAKQAATRERRIAQAAEWIAEGKARNWKYQKR
ncbi:YdeI/OmpD-associated family protein [Luteimonas saliphila]|uniref:YdeI/OmpD-associated family protein n=1 Tax=Luteimonas saliphila TaxID=2804919 RepID=UPI00192D7F0F|nr:YdeI/OmpD-associated family protein [Luteimonas saliphila]